MRRVKIVGTRPSGGRIVIAFLITALIVFLLTLSFQREEEKKDEKTETIVVLNEAEIRKYQKIEGIVNNWISEDKFTRPEISIRDVAMEIGTNTNYLSGYINKVLKTTFTSWLNTLRIEKSKEYLCGKERISVEECGSKVGYLSIYNYSRWFKLITGMSPSEWRKNQCER
jgi:YesN/AraC family two-component response regulator